MNDYHWYRDERWTYPVVCRRQVPVVFEGHVVSGVMANICRLVEGGAFSLDIDAYGPYELLHEKATRLLQARSRILPIESVGYPECTGERVTIRRSPEPSLEARRQMLEQIPDAARTMKKNHTAADQATLMLAKWAAETNFPEDLEHYIHQFLRPQTWRTWNQRRI